MNKFWNKITSLGIDPSMEDDLQAKIKLSNILAFILCCIVISYGIISAMVVKEVVIYWVYAFIAYTTVLLLNSARLHVLSRFLISIAPGWVVATLHGVVLMEADLAIKEIYAFQVFSTLIPLSVFQIRHYYLWLPAVLINLIHILGIGEINDFYDLVFDNSALALTWVRIFIMMGSVLLGGFLLFFLQSISKDQNLKVKKLVYETEEKNKEYQKKEEELKMSVEKIEKAQEEERKRNWASQGLAEVAGIMRTEDNLDVLVDKIVSYVVQYLNANQGALFLLNDDGGEDNSFLEMKGCYAYSRKKHMEKNIQLGQGIVGQCFFEKDYILLKTVPENYVEITSGLGKATPRTVLVAPLLANEKVYGVFEVASFKDLEQYQIDFLMDLGENIAMTLNNIKTNVKTRILLEETQEQSQQLISQEEEMRQNMEELQATQEQQQRLEDELRKKLEEVEKERDEALKHVTV